MYVPPGFPGTDLAWCLLPCLSSQSFGEMDPSTSDKDRTESCSVSILSLRFPIRHPKTDHFCSRARYMRLPAAAPRPVTSALSRPLPQPSSSRVLVRPRARPPSPDPTTEVETDADNPPRPPHRPVTVTASAPIPTHVRGPSTARSKPPGSRTGIASLLSSRPHNTGLSKLGKDRDRDSSPTRDRPRFTTRSVVSGGTRDSSPTKMGRDLSPTRTAPVMGPGSVDTMSEAGGGGGRAKGSLWTELKEIQRKSRTPTVRSFRSTPDPP